ncbi:acyltransferase family protein [Marinagarivorans cellulosilyticus]|uniref:Acyltransferase 3 domain-containing protein n=1 Tax=Marinagarivorans cellulosilyticus TaxID=2721545 RepID=A0AAN2BIL1_9GAMM|nr:acyltransferase [Marinagarivorans cellulosilyticus]BCD95986.1 hypothetical protein MARGE09_P0185 [Marinagarivorans cellulosilyticus]
MKYRAEIDGLRAVAVIPVILFHAGISGFSGGYVGVDIFFVISGFLITTIIINELNDNSFSIVNFYERRARRILPALMVMLATTSIAAYILMPATLLKSYSDSVFSVVTFLSNVYFFLTNGYFSTASDEKPLLHTWSLAVEEQYYVFFPLLMLYLASTARWKIVTLLAGISVASLCLSEYLSIRQFKDANFYLITSRAWELLAGSLLAFYPRTTAGNKPKFDEIMAGIGLLLIIYSIIFYTHKTPFPGVYAIVPVLGAALIIRYATSTTLVGKLLSLKPFVWIGAISYSLYLWHQPLFAFLRMKFQHEPSIEHFSVAIVCTFILA